MGSLFDKLKWIKAVIDNENKKTVPTKKLEDITNLKAPSKTTPLNANALNPKTASPRLPKTLATPGPENKPLVDASNNVSLQLPTYSTLLRKNEFKKAEKWVALGQQTQRSSLPIGNRIEVYIGLDFGTAFTKVAIGLLDKIYPIEWEGLLNLRSKYLLPTEYTSLPNGYSFLGQHPDAHLEDLVTGIKQPFILTDFSAHHMAHASVFLALVLQYVRGWTYEKHGKKFGAAPLGWYLNIGTPSNSFEENSRSNAYRKLSKAAWFLSQRAPEDINYKSAIAALDSVTDKNPHDLRETDPIPEFVAQLAGYSKSAQRQNGLHALIDIGGGTVDMVTFNVHRANDEDVFPFFVPKVKPLGTYAIIENRLQSLPDKNLRFQAEVENLLNAHVFAELASVHIEKIQASDRIFFDSFKNEFSDTLRVTHQKRYPDAPQWKTGIRTFITGGGSALQGYKIGIETSYRPENCPLILTPLPPHPRLDGYTGSPDEYNRISVACGLATDSQSLGEIRPASEVPDVPITPRTPPLKERPSHEDLYG